jgi:hypothetical protein
VDVEKDEIEFLGAEHLDRLGSVAGSLHLKPLKGEMILDEVPKILLIVSI